MTNENGLTENHAALLRLPLHRAPFYFAPHFLATPEIWRDWFIDQANYVAATTSKLKPIIEEYREYILRVRFQYLEFFVDAQTGCFSVWKINDGEDDLTSTWCATPILPAHKFIRMAETKGFIESIPEQLRLEMKDEVFEFARMLQLLMRRRFEQAIHQGFAKIEVKYKSLASSFSHVPLSELKYFTPMKREEGDVPGFDCDFRLDDGETSQGIRFFSLGVVQTSKSYHPTNGTENHLGIATNKGMASDTSMSCAVQPRKRGRKSYDWDNIKQFMFEQMTHHGDFMLSDPEWNAAERLVEVTRTYCKKTLGIEISKSSIKKYVPAVCERYRESKDPIHRGNNLEDKAKN